MKFKSDIEVQAGLKDSSGAAGTSGQVLSSNGTTVSWVNAGSSVASDVQNQVKAGVAINKGQAVYVTSADGTNIIVGLASNTSEATSSKTLGLLNATVAVNGFADVVQIGKLAGLNTIGATVGDPVWLGANGNLIYGLANKPYAPLHLVYIGVVTRVNANNGEIFINVQNGFELKELHDVSAQTPSNNNGIFYNTSNGLWEAKAISAAGGIEGSGTTNYVPKFTGASTIGNSAITDNGSLVEVSSREFRISAGTTSSFAAGITSHSSFAFGSTNGRRVSIIADNTGQSNGLQFGYDDVDNTGIIAASTQGAATGLDFYTYNGSAWGNRMRISSAGNLLIGTTTDAGYKIDVNGTGRFNGVSASPVLYLTNASGGTTSTFTITENTGLIINSYESTSARSIDLRVGGTSALTIASSQAATFSSAVTNTSGMLLNVGATGANANLNYTTFTNGVYSALNSATPTEGVGMWSDNQGNGMIGSLYNNNASSLNLVVKASSSTNGFVALKLQGTGVATFSSLAGSGTRFVVADTSGSLSTTTGGPISGSGSSGQVTFWNGTNSITGESNLFWDSTNDRLGIGTASPSFPLHLYKASSDVLLALQKGINFGYVVNDGTNILLGSNLGTTGYKLLVNMSAPDNSMIINSSGNVGIGTSTDAGYKLDISGNIRMFGSSDMSSTIESTGTNNAAALILKSGNGTTSGLYSYLRFINNNTNQQEWRLGTYGNNNFTFVNSKAGTTPMIISTSGEVTIAASSAGNSLTVNGRANDWATVINGNTTTSQAYGLKVKAGTNSSDNSFLVNNTSDAQLFRVRGDGNVAVGTSNPSAKLEVLQANGNGLTSGFSGIHVMQSNASVSEDVAARMTFNADGGATVYGFIEQRRNASDSLALGTRNSTGAAGYISLVTQGTEKTRVFANGNVFIGSTPTDAGWKLDVNGTGRFSGQLNGTVGISVGANSLGTDRMFQVSGTAFTTGTTQFGIVNNPTMATPTNIYGYYGTVTVTSATNAYSVYIGTVSGTVTNKYGIYQTGADDKNYFAGNIGIGNANPSYKLDVSGSIRVGDSSTSIFTATNALPLQLSRGLDVDVYGTNGCSLGIGSIKAGVHKDGVRLSGNLEADGVNGNFFIQALRSNSYETALTAKANGNILINTTTDAGWKLDVNGNTRFTGFSRIDRGTLQLTLNPSYGGGDVFSQVQSTAALALSTGGGGVNRLYITSGGNVGIGTDAPPRLFSVSTNTGNLVASTTVIAITSGGQFGSIGTPKNLDLAFLGNANNELARIRSWDESYSTGYGALSFFVNNASALSERMRIFPNGNVVIGSSPTDAGYKLDVNGSIRSTTSITSTSGDFYATDGTRNSFFGVSTGQNAGMVGTTSNHDLKLITNNTTKLTITSGGNVGIGTPSPTAYTGGNVVLQVNTSSVISDIRLTNNFTTSNTEGGLIRQDGNQMFVWNASAGQLGFGTSNQQRMTITSGGNVGIGAIDPYQKLTVEGTIATKPAGVDAYYSYLRSNWAADNAFELGIGDRNSLNKLITSSNYYYGSTLQLWTDNTERVRIFSGGNVFIGSAPTDAGYKLDVNGSGRFSETLNVNSGLQFRYNGAFRGQIVDYNSYGGGSDYSPFFTSESSLAFGVNGTSTKILNLAIDGKATFSSTVTAKGFYTPGFTIPTTAKAVINNTSYGGPAWNNASLVTGNGATGVIFGGDAASYTYGWIQGVQTDNGAGKNLALQPIGGDVLIGTTTAGGAGLTIADAKYIWSVGTYNNTTANAANMWIGASGIFGRSTSSIKYKKDVENYDKGIDIVNKLRPVYYKGLNDGDTVFAGLIAEEVHDLGLTEFVQYAEDGSPDALAYQNMVALLIKAVQELKAEIEILKNK